MNADHPEVREQFRRAVDRADQAIDLAAAALLIAKEEYPRLDVRAYLRRLDRLAERVRARLTSEATTRERAEAISAVLFEEEGLEGNRRDYYDPQNSFLNDVLDRKLGIPITLSIVYLAVAQRIGLQALGIGLPGHFVVGVTGEPSFLVDPFAKGRFLTQEDCARRVAEIYGRRLAFQPSMLAPVTHRQILLRVLGNLKAIYLNGSDYGRALAVVDRLLLLDPALTGELRDRGIISQRLRFNGQALADFARYLSLAPAARDADAVREMLAALRREAIPSN